MHKIKKREGIIVSKLLIDLMRTSVKNFLHEDNASSHGDELMICAAVFIGHADGKPFTTGKIAAYIGMPRPTVARKLKSLELRGYVKTNGSKKWEIAMDHRDIRLRVNKNIDAHTKQIHRAAAELSSLDNAAIARQRRRS